MENKKVVPKINLIKVTVLIVLIIALLSYVGVVIFNLIANPTDTFIIENGKLYLEEKTDGYILREEVIVQGENYKNGIVQIKSECEKVAKNDAIFRYKSNGEEKLLQKIEDLNVKIQEALKNETNPFPSDIALLENQIQEKVYSMYSINKFSDINSLKNNKSISKKMQY